MRVLRLSTVLSIMLVGRLAAQSGTAAFVTTLGQDTIAVERFSRTASTLEGDLVTRVPQTRIVHYKATLAAGQVTRFDLTARTPGGTAPLFTTVTVFAPDTATLEIHRGDSTRTLKMAVHPGAVPFVFGSYALTEQAVMQAVAGHQDSVTIDLVANGARQALEMYVARHGRDSVAVDHFGTPGLARISPTGQLLGYDGRLTTEKHVVHRVGDINVEQMAAQFAARDAAGQGIGMLSSRDTVRATLGAAHVQIDYGRPQRRGRVIFGNIVPWNQVWRTGANAATQFTTDAPLTLGGVELAPGTYTLWTIPRQGGARLIINKQHGQWGTDYDATQDLAQVDISVTALPQPVEQFTIAVTPAGSGGTLTMAWDQTRYTVPVVAR